MILDPAFTHNSLQRLHINNNGISEWAELEKLGHTFPALHTLVAIANPLSKITVPIASPHIFPSLNCLTLNSTQLSKWSSIEALATFPDLVDLSLLNVPLGQHMRESERRFAIIARLPSLQLLNKSQVTPTERENAERWAIRHYHDKKDKLHTYQQLVNIHGLLQPLADVNLLFNTRLPCSFMLTTTIGRRLKYIVLTSIGLRGS